jgi:hypothetical protein
MKTLPSRNKQIRQLTDVQEKTLTRLDGSFNSINTIAIVERANTDNQISVTFFRFEDIVGYKDIKGITITSVTLNIWANILVRQIDKNLLLPNEFYLIIVKSNNETEYSEKIYRLVDIEANKDIVYKGLLAVTELFKDYHKDTSVFVKKGLKRKIEQVSSSEEYVLSQAPLETRDTKALYNLPLYNSLSATKNLLIQFDEIIKLYPTHSLKLFLVPVYIVTNLQEYNLADFSCSLYGTRNISYRVRNNY